MYNLSKELSFKVAIAFNKNPNLNSVYITSDNILHLSESDAVKHIKESSLNNVNYDIIYASYLPKTAIIYNEIESIKYLIVFGDFTRFNGVCLNSTNPHEYNNEFTDIFFDAVTGDYLFDMSEDISIINDKQWNNIIMCTFLP